MLKKGNSDCIPNVNLNDGLNSYLQIIIHININYIAPNFFLHSSIPHIHSLYIEYMPILMGLCELVLLLEIVGFGRVLTINTEYISLF